MWNKIIGLYHANMGKILHASINKPIRLKNYNYEVVNMKKLRETITVNGETFIVTPEATAIRNGHATSSDLFANALGNGKGFDYGLGTGRNIEYIFKEYGKIIDGCDIPEQLARQNYSNIVANGSKIGLSNNFDSSSYDSVLCSFVLNVIHDDKIKQSVMNDIARLLKKGGTLFLEVRTKNDVKSSSTKKEYEDGFIIPKGKKKCNLSRDSCT